MRSDTKSAARINTLSDAMGFCEAGYAATEHQNWDDVRRLCAVRFSTDRSNVMDDKIRDIELVSLYLTWQHTAFYKPRDSVGPFRMGRNREAITKSDDPPPASQNPIASLNVFIRAADIEAAQYFVRLYLIFVPYI